MPVSPVNSAPPTNGIQRTNSQSESQQFLQLLTTKLANQNPLEPISDSDFTNQISQLNQIEAVDRQTSLLENIAVGIQTTNILQGLGQASVLIDKSVTYIKDGVESEGIVRAVKFEGGGIQLDVDGELISLGSLIGVESGQFANNAPAPIAEDSGEETADDATDDAVDDTVESVDSEEATAEAEDG